MHVAIVIPTFNEIDNIVLLVDKLQTLPFSKAIVIVDDNSNDGTAEALDSLKNKCDNVFPIHRQGKRSFARSYAEGFLFALKLDSNIIIQMDADLSHDPVQIPSFIASLSSNDVIVGSRYVNGGCIKGWNFTRRMISWFGNVFAHFILRIPVRDLTSGYKSYRVGVIKSIFFENIKSEKYAFQIETLWEIFRRGYRISEIPITFTQRQLGKSKFHFRTFIEAFYIVLSLSFRRPPTAVPMRTNEFNSRVKRFYAQEEDYDWENLVSSLRTPEALFHSLRERFLLQAIEKYGKEPYLDVGCGSGLILKHLPSGSVGVDINSRSIERAKKHAPHARVLLQDAEALSFPPELFSTVICTEVLEHLVHPEYTISAIHKILKPNGIFIASVPRQSLIWKMRWISFSCPRIEPFHCEFKEKEINALVGSSFSKISITPKLFRSSFLIIARKDE